MTPDQRLCEMVADNPRFLHPMITDDVRAVLAQRDRYEKALKRIADGRFRDDNDSAHLAQEALRCE